MSDKPKTQTLKPELVGHDDKFFPAKLTQLSALPADHKFYAMAGRVASEWSHIEHRLDTIIWTLLRASDELATSNQKAACVTAQLMGVSPRCKAIITLGSLIGLKEQTINEAITLMNKANGVVEGRNRIVHDPWYIEHPSGKAGQFKAMPFKGKQYGLTEITLTEIETILTEIKKIFDATIKLRQRVKDELQALLEKQR